MLYYFTRINQRLLIILINFIIAASPLWGQQYNFRQYGVEQGVAQSDILAILQTEKGYLLYGSNGGGLGFFDGVTFSNITRAEGLSNNVVFGIIEDKEHYIWAFTNSGISKIDLSNDSVLLTIAEEKPFYTCFYDKSKEVLYTADNKTLYKIENDSLLKIPVLGLPASIQVSAINIRQSDSSLWVGTQLQGIYVIKNNMVIKHITAQKGLSTNYIKKIFFDEDNHVTYIGTLAGIDKILSDYTVVNMNLFKNSKKWGGIPITDIVKYNNNLVLSSLNGLFFLDDNEKVNIWINGNNGLPVPKIWKVLIDDEGNLWCASLGKGLLMYQPEFTYYTKTDGLLDEYIFALHHYQNQVYIGTKSYGLYSVNIDNDSLKELNNSSKIVYSIVHFNDTLFLGTNEGLAFYNEQTKYIENIALDNNVYVLEKYDSLIYIATQQGLYRYKNHIELDTSFEQIPYYGMLVSENDIWLSSDGKITHRKNSKTITYSNGETYNGQKIIFNRARTIIQDSLKHIWVATDMGAYIFTKEDSVFHLSTKNGLASNNIYLLEIDEDNNVWLGTDKGLNKVTKLNYKNYVIEAIEYYGYNEGFKGVETNLNSVEVDNKGNVWFGTVNGVYRYNKSEYVHKNILPKLNFKELKVNNKVYPVLSKSLELEYNQSSLEFNFVAVYFKNPQRVVYKYRLLGVSDKWSEPFSDNKLKFNKLSAGHYTVEIIASADGRNWTQPYQLSFQILPPFYQSTTAYVLFFMLIIAIFYTFYLIRTKNLQRKKAELEYLVNERTQELKHEKERVEKQNEIINIANKNITDSINYAQKIQQSLLPEKERLPIEFKDVAVLYLPKDIVSGDFYWMDKVGNKIILCAADCTGHGVPGAFMSMLGINILNQIVIEKRILNPSQILFHLNNTIKKALRQDGDLDGANKDGMDIAISVVDLDTNTLTFAGAFRPLIIIKSDTGELMELKADRKSIGGYTEVNAQFSEQSVQVNKNDVIYMYSDGYPDQFGGPKGKKFMNKRLLKLFNEIFSKPINEQIKILDASLLEWRADEEQVDDVLVLIAKI